MKKRGQITVFMIIGIVLVFSIALFVYLRSETSIFKPKVVVPERTDPVQKLVQDCMAKEAKDGIYKMGLQGGYIKIPNEISMNPWSNIQLIPNGPYKVPYWYYNNKPMYPTMEDMQKELSIYVAENIKTCLKNFSDFSEEFDIKELGEPVIKATFAEEEVYVEAIYPIEVGTKPKTKTIKLNSYLAKVPARMKKIYDLAKDIMDRENSEAFLESFTIDLMSMNSETIPMTGMKFECSRKTWLRSTIAEDVKNIVYYNLPRIRVNRTDYPRFLPAEQYAKVHWLFDVTSNNYKDLSVGFEYRKEWPFFLDVRPRFGNVLKSNVGGGIKQYLSFLCVNIWHFTYDVNYPVMVPISDPKSFDGEGYVFRFATPVIVSKNEGARTSAGTTEYNVPEPNDEFCDIKTDKQYEFRAKDIRTNEDLKGINISFNCIVLLCKLGTTEFDGTTHYSLKASLPSGCTGGYIIAEGTGENTGKTYKKLEKHVVLEEMSTETPINLELKSYKKLEYDIVKHPSNALGTQNTLAEDETVLIDITNATEDFSITAAYPAAAKDLQTMDLIEDTVKYNIDLTLIKNNKIIGGYKSKFTADYDALQESTKIILPIIEYIPAGGSIETIEQQGEAISWIENSTNYAGQVKVELQ